MTTTTENTPARYNINNNGCYACLAPKLTSCPPPSRPTDPQTDKPREKGIRRPVSDALTEILFLFHALVCPPYHDDSHVLFESQLLLTYSWLYSA